MNIRGLTRDMPTVEVLRIARGILYTLCTKLTWHHWNIRSLMIALLPPWGIY